jgi:hypothetical protein
LKEKEKGKRNRAQEPQGKERIQEKKMRGKRARGKPQEPREPETPGVTGAGNQNQEYK